MQLFYKFYTFLLVIMSLSNMSFAADTANKKMLAGQITFNELVAESPQCAVSLFLVLTRSSLHLLLSLRISKLMADPGTMLCRRVCSDLVPVH